MTSIAGHRRWSQRRRDTHPHPVVLSESGLAGEPGSTINPHRRGGTVIFEILLTTAMTDAHLELLRRRLDMTTHIEQKLHPDPGSPGVVRLDHFSGLFLEHGAGDDEWVLQARTWGAPPASTIQEWRVRAAQAARALDPRVATDSHGARESTADLRSG